MQTEAAGTTRAKDPTEAAARDVLPAEVLSRARERVDPVLRAAVGALPHRIRHVAGYHLGWWDAHGTPAQRDSGKAVRPALVLATARAAGGVADGRADSEAVAHAAAAVELVHNFTLLHDDVMDGDELRRHRPTAWSVFGVPGAILAGDALLALATDVLARDVDDVNTVARDAGTPALAAARLASCVIELCEGQQADCGFQERTDVGMAECLAMTDAKTGALLGCACALGAQCAGADETVVAAMDAFGRRLGTVYQLVDDILGIWGDPRTTGKPAGADLSVRKKSLAVVAALTSGTAAGRELAAVYATDAPLTAEELRYTAALVERAGGREWARVRADELTRLALEDLARVFPGSRTADELLCLTRLITRRDR